MLINSAYRYELDPNVKQCIALLKHAGTRRFAWNWALARRIERFQTHEGKKRFSNAIEDHREWNVWKKENASWSSEVSKCAPQEAFRDLDKAFGNMNKAKKSGCKVGFPKFKKKFVHDSFRLTGSNKKGEPSNIRAIGDHVVLPKLGQIKTKETTRVQGRILSCVVRREADRWFVSFAVEKEIADPTQPKGGCVGIDLGLDTFATLSDGTKFHAPKPLKKNLDKLKRLSKRYSRKVKGSNNRKKSARKLARLHYIVKNQRRDFINKITTLLAKTKSTIIIEDLAVKNMQRNSRLSRSISDVGWSEFRQKLMYKTRWYGSELVVADRWFPSSKKCHVCGYIHADLKLEDRVWACPNCNTKHDRDFNAAINLENYIPGVPWKFTPAEIGAVRLVVESGKESGKEYFSIHL